MANPALKPDSPQRLLSIDVLRGITIAFMIMVNNNGGPGSWGFMNHAQWNGLTPTDLVFPRLCSWSACPSSSDLNRACAKARRRTQLAWHTVQRAVILFALGMVVNTFPFFDDP